MQKEEFINDFINYFNENIKNENVKINQECNLEKAKLMIVLEGFISKEIKRAYGFIIKELHAQNLSIDYISPEMVSIVQEPDFEKRRDKRPTLSITGVSSRKPLKQINAVVKKIKDEKELKEYKNILISHYNKCYKLHKNKLNTYDTFEFVISQDELCDKDVFKDRIHAEANNLEYKIYQLKSDLLDIEFNNNNFLVRYNYGE